MSSEFNNNLPSFVISLNVESDGINKVFSNKIASFSSSVPLKDEDTLYSGYNDKPSLIDEFFGKFLEIVPNIS